MSLAYAIQRAAPWYQMQDTSNAILNGEDPFFQNLPGKNLIPATGGLPALASMINHGGTDPLGAAASIDPLFSQGNSGAATSTATAAPSSPIPIYTPPAFTNPFAGIHLKGGVGNDMLATWAKNQYDNTNFNHYAAPDGSKLPFVGPNYLKYGDMKGYWYDPFTDRYKTNENALIDAMGNQGAITNQAKIYQKFGLVPQTPSTGSQLLNTLLGAGTLGLGSYLGKNSGSLLDSIFGALTGGSGGDSVFGALTGDSTAGPLAQAVGALGFDPTGGLLSSLGGDSSGGIIGDIIGGVGDLFGGIF